MTEACEEVKKIQQSIKISADTTTIHAAFYGHTDYESVLSSFTPDPAQCGNVRYRIRRHVAPCRAAPRRISGVKEPLVGSPNWRSSLEQALANVN